MVLHVLFMGVLFVGLPAVSVAQLPLLKNVALERVPAYLGSIIAISLLAVVSLAVGIPAFGVDGIGLGWPGAGTVAGATAAVLVAAGALLVLFWGLGKAIGLEEASVLRDLLPVTATEKRVFVGLSFAAGIGEELAYRAYAIAVLQVWGLGPWTALAVASVPFSVVHVYQGGIGVARTYLLGLALGASLLVTGSLWPAMLAHTLIDLAGGLFLGERLLGPSPTDPAPAAG